MEGSEQQGSRKEDGHFGSSERGRLGCSDRQRGCEGTESTQQSSVANLQGCGRP